jgi:hypothetical protein
LKNFYASSPSACLPVARSPAPFTSAQIALLTKGADCADRLSQILSLTIFHFSCVFSIFQAALSSLIFNKTRSAQKHKLVVGFLKKKVKKRERTLLKFFESPQRALEQGSEPSNRERVTRTEGFLLARVLKV